MFHQQPRLRFGLSRLTANSLVRACDRIEFAIHATAVLLIIAAIPICLAVGSAVHAGMASDRRAELASRTQVTATLLAPASTSTGAATARWTSPGPDHPVITGAITVPSDRLNSATTPIWVDRTTGLATTAPTSASTVWALTINTGIASFAITFGAIAAFWGFTTAGFARYRSRRWAAEWRRCSALEPSAFIAWTPATQLGKE